MDEKQHRTHKPNELLDVRTREIVIELNQADRLVIGLPVEVSISPSTQGQKVISPSDEDRELLTPSLENGSPVTSASEPRLNMELSDTGKINKALPRKILIFLRSGNSQLDDRETFTQWKAPMEISQPTLVSHAILRDLVDAAHFAPSPDNNQPWGFGLEDRGIRVFHKRDRALPSDVRDFFSWIGLGAAIENITLRAARHELIADVDYFPRPFHTDSSGEQIAFVSFSHAKTEIDPLANGIEKRSHVSLVLRANAA